MESLHMPLFTIFVLAIPTFCRIYPSPIDDAIQPEISYGPVRQVLAKPTKNVKHHEHVDQKRFPDPGGSAEGGNNGNSGGCPPVKYELQSNLHNPTPR
ncbi:hypothetical protein Ddc_18285 [Ditylenchus destructor]|nr:hypothetical protein Ddc_18285 [Ditylenchus destructor]